MSGREKILKLLAEDALRSAEERLDPSLVALAIERIEVDPELGALFDSLEAEAIAAEIRRLFAFE